MAASLTPAATTETIAAAVAQAVVQAMQTVQPAQPAVTAQDIATAIVQAQQAVPPAQPAPTAQDIATAIVQAQQAAAAAAAPPPPVFALTPAQSVLGPLTYDGSEGASIYKEATKSLYGKKHDPFDGTEEGLTTFRNRLLDQAREHGWIGGPDTDTLLMVPTAIATPT